MSNIIQQTFLSGSDFCNKKLITFNTWNIKYSWISDNLWLKNLNISEIDREKLWTKIKQKINHSKFSMEFFWEGWTGKKEQKTLMPNVLK